MTEQTSKLAFSLLRIAREILAIEFDTKKEMDEYRKRHKVRKDTRLTVKKQPGKRPSKKPVQEAPVREDVKDEWFDRPFSKDRMIYHGTTKKGWAQIQKDGHLKPHEADNNEDGDAVWFTSDLENAKQYSKNGGVVIGIKHGDALEHKHHRYSPLSPAMVKQLRSNGKSDDKIKEYLHDFDFVVHENIPLKKVQVVNFKD